MNFAEQIKQETLPTLAGNKNTLLELNINVKVEHEPDYYEGRDWIIPINEKVCFKTENCYNTIGYEQLKKICMTKCTICYTYFYDQYSLVKHNLTHLQVNLPWIYECNDCPNIYFVKDLLESHIKQSHTIVKKSHKCKVCNKTFTYSNWHSHVKEVHGPRVHECKVCHHKYKSKRYLKRHILYRHESTKRPLKLLKLDNIKVKCSICATELANKSALKTHIRNCHSESAICLICGSKLKSNAYLLAHIRRVHYDDGKSYNCSCGKSFRSPRYLKVHQRNSKHFDKA